MGFSRRQFLGRSAASAAGLALGSSAAAASTTYAAPAVLQNGGRVQVVYWTTFSTGINGDAQNALIDEFHASQDDIEIVVEGYENYESVASALISGLQTGDSPAMTLFSEAWWFRFYLGGFLADLNDFVDEAEVEDYVPTLYEEYQRAGGQWAIPFARSTPLLYVNTEILDQAGVDIDVYSQWSTLKEAAPDIVAGSDAQYAFAYGSAAGYGAWYLQGTVWGHNGAYSDPDLNILLTEEGAVEAGESMREFIQSGNAAAVQVPTDDFINGITAASFASTGSLGSLTEAAGFEFQTAFMPAEHTFGCSTGGAGLSIMNTEPDEVQQAAWEFIDFCTNTENTATWSQATGYLPVRLSARDSDEMQAYFDENPNARTAVEQLEQVQEVDSVMVQVPNGAQIIGQGWEQILVNEVDPADAWAETTSQLDTDKQPILEEIEAVEG